MNAWTFSLGSNLNSNVIVGFTFSEGSLCEKWGLGHATATAKRMPLKSLHKHKRFRCRFKSLHKQACLAEAYI